MKQTASAYGLVNSQWADLRSECRGEADATASWARRSEAWATSACVCVTNKERNELKSKWYFLLKDKTDLKKVRVKPETTMFCCEPQQKQQIINIGMNVKN